MEDLNVLKVLFLCGMIILCWETFKGLFMLAYLSIRLWYIQLQLDILKKKDEYLKDELL